MTATITQLHPQPSAPAPDQAARRGLSHAPAPVFSSPEELARFRADVALLAASRPAR